MGWEFILFGEVVLFNWKNGRAEGGEEKHRSHSWIGISTPETLHLV